MITTDLGCLVLPAVPARLVIEGAVISLPLPLTPRPPPLLAYQATPLFQCEIPISRPMYSGTYRRFIYLQWSVSASITLPSWGRTN